jgi:hypothetical protein
VNEPHLDPMELLSPDLFGPEDDSVLVACPTYSGLSSCLDEYLAAYRSLRWSRRNLMLVDNTRDGGAYAGSIKGKVEDVGGTLRRIEPSDDWEDTFCRAWGLILTHALWNSYTWVLSLEQDVIVPPLTLDTLLNVAGYIKAPFVTHTYPYHNGKPGYYQGLGCTLMKTELLNGALSYAYKRIPTVEGAIYDVAKRNTHVVLHQLLPIEHRDDPTRHWQFEKTTTDDVPVLRADEASIGIES